MNKRRVRNDNWPQDGVENDGKYVHAGLFITNTSINLFLYSQQGNRVNIFIISRWFRRILFVFIPHAVNKIYSMYNNKSTVQNGVNITDCTWII